MKYTTNIAIIICEAGGGKKTYNNTNAINPNIYKVVMIKNITYSIVNISKYITIFNMQLLVTETVKKLITIICINVQWAIKWNLLDISKPIESVQFYQSREIVACSRRIQCNIINRE
jgi:hypothetical protein